MNFHKRHKPIKTAEELHLLVDLSNPKEKEEFDQIAFQLDLMHEVKKLMNLNGWNQNDLSSKLGKSKSYISQLFAGDKLLNIKTIIKLQNIFNVKFSITTSIHKSENRLNEEFAHFLEIVEYYVSSSQLSEIMLTPKQKKEKLSPVRSEICYVNNEGTLINKTKTILEAGTYVN